MSDRAKYWNGSRWEVKTAFSLAKLSPQGIPMNSKCLRCPCCLQPLTLVCAINKVPYFRHPSSEQDKSCALRAQTFRYYGFEAGERQYPLKIQIVGRGIQFFIGFFRVSEELLSDGFTFELRVLMDDRKWKEKKFHSDRVFASTMTYLGIGSQPPIEVVVNAPRETEWPRTRVGVKQTGSLFDADSGKLLPNDADVVVGKNYFLLIKTGELQKNPDRYSLSIKKEPVDIEGWDLFICRADRATEGSANFFFKYAANLTDRPATITPIWPIVSRSSYELCSTSKVLYLAYSGDLQSKIRPEGCYLQLADNRSSNLQTSKVLEINSIYRPIISLGRSNLIKFVQVIYKQKEETSRFLETNLSIKDIEGNDINEDVLLGGLERNSLICASNINLNYRIYKDFVLIDIGEIQSNSDKKISLCSGQTLKVFNGKDLVRKLHIESPKHKKEITGSAFEFDHYGIHSVIPSIEPSSLPLLAYKKKVAREKQLPSRLKGLSMLQLYQLIK